MSPVTAHRLLALLALSCGALGASCGSSAPATGPVGGPVTDASDQHCMPNGTLAAQPVGMCMAAGGEDGGTAPDYGETLYGSDGYDDDCKYHVSFESTPIRKDASVTFTVTVDQLDPAKPALGADLFAEVYLTPVHPAPNSGQKTTEVGGGVYKVGPIVFNASGIWTVRFHMYEMCSDVNTDSPHGHAAFFIQVP
jgi:hypothetical protein